MCVFSLLMEKNKSLKRQQINSTDSDWKVNIWPYFPPSTWSMTAKPHKLQNWRKKVQFVTGWDLKSCLLTKKIDLESAFGPAFIWVWRVNEWNKLGILLSSNKGQNWHDIYPGKGILFWAFQGYSVECFEPQRAPLGRIQFFQSYYYKAFLTFESCKSYGM